MLLCIFEAFSSWHCPDFHSSFSSFIQARRVLQHLHSFSLQFSMALILCCFVLCNFNLDFLRSTVRRCACVLCFYLLLVLTRIPFPLLQGFLTAPGQETCQRLRKSNLLAASTSLGHSFLPPLAPFPHLTQFLWLCVQPLPLVNLHFLFLSSHFSLSHLSVFPLVWVWRNTSLIYFEDSH